MRRPLSSGAGWSAPSRPTWVEGWTTAASAGADALGVAATATDSAGTAASLLGCGAALEQAAANDKGSTTRQAPADMSTGHAMLGANAARKRASSPPLQVPYSMKSDRTIAGNRCVFRDSFYVEPACP